MVVQHNLTAMNANRYFGMNNNKLSKSLEKLSSGYAINRAGDNAAGLAVSEKMRAQIGGITQAVKNANDGISMVQTFEGALTETDNILQRMRSLATQSANGSYDDSVDRAAIQLEYDQLNDELNQIADTDFNGVVVLNGGVMADGTKADATGLIDYAVAGNRDPKQLNSKEINLVGDQKFNDVETTNGRTKADTVWADLFDDIDRTDATKSNGPDSTEITMKFDSTTGAWTVNGTTNGAKADAITVGDTDNGGFSLTAGGVEFANVVVDQSSLQNGDTLVIKLDNPYGAVSAPTNATAKVSENKLTAGSATTILDPADANLDVTLETITDANWTKNLNDIAKNLEGATVEVTYKADAAAVGDIKITFADGSSYTQAAGAEFTFADGTKAWIAGTAGKIEISTSTGTAAGTKLLTLDQAAQVGTTGATTGTISYKIGMDNYSYDNSKTPTISISDPSDMGVSDANSNKQAASKLTYTDSVTLQVGARTKDSVNFTFKYKSTDLGGLEADLNCTAKGLGTDKLSLATQEDANKAIDQIDKSINKISMVRGSFGAIQNRLEHKIDNLNTTNENLTAAESRIRDTDMASEMMNFTKNQILAQASQSMLAQANQLPQGVLSLLQ